jgi:MazG family protein
VKAEDAQQVLKNWEAFKAEEKRKKRQQPGESKEGEAGNEEETLLGSVSSRMPALMEAHKISSKAAHVGFDWPEIEGLFAKLTEETEELQEHIRDLPADALKGRNNSRIPEELRARIEDEVGDLFFVLVNIARYLAVDAESALRKTNRKFRRRFGWVEEQLRRRGKRLEDSNVDEMEELWQEAKKSSI